MKNHVRQDSKYARGGEMRNVVDRCTKFAVLCDESFLISKKDIKKSAILRAIANEVFGFKKTEENSK